MKFGLFRFVIAALACFTCLQGTEWPAVPPEIWAIKGDRSNPHGAVVLDEWVRYGVKETEVRKRIRIFGEAGKGAAALPAFNTSTSWKAER